MDQRATRGPSPSRTRGHVRGSLGVLALRIALLLAALALAVTGVVLFLPGAPHDAAVRFSCPMHAEVKRKSPGVCPICRMALTEDGASPVLSIPARAARAEPAARRASREHFASGVPWLPTTRPLAALSKPKDGPLLGSAVRRTLKGELEAAAYLEAPGVVAAVLYRDVLPGLEPGSSARFFPASQPRAAIEVRRNDQPPESWDARTVLVRFRVDAQASSVEARPGEPGRLELGDASHDALVIPESALLWSERGPYLLVVDEQARSFVRRHVEIGRIVEGLVVIEGGLRKEERLAVGGAFFLDAELPEEEPKGPMLGVVP